jgi:hypothetical protein
MIQTPQEKLRTLFPHLDETEIAAAYERLRRYVALAIEVVREEKQASGSFLTETSAGGSVNAGQVESRTFKNTG